MLYNSELQMKQWEDKAQIYISKGSLNVLFSFVSERGQKELECMYTRARVLRRVVGVVNTAVRCGLVLSG